MVPLSRAAGHLGSEGAFQILAWLGARHGLCQAGSLPGSSPSSSHGAQRSWSGPGAAAAGRNPAGCVAPAPEHRGPCTEQHSDEGCLRYVVLGTMAAIVALFLNVFYPLISQSRWR
uniref:Uncharacterized protein n=1 Tax=Gopherus evgoodei TaxID=1825980 RepID=A0A8C4Y2C1_9SAUR